MWRAIYYYLASVKLAIALLIIILVCCLLGVTVVRGAEAGALIFGTIWFNGLLVLLVVNVAFCFFGRIWGRKVTLVSLGMILFHLCFVAMLGGIVYNSLFYFRGMIRLAEGETLPSGELSSYDYADHGRFFDFARLKGQTTLVKMYKGYIISGEEKQVAYDVAVGEKSSTTRGIIYITHKLHHSGIDYFRDREGYSLLIVLHDKQGREFYGAHIPLQSLKKKDDTYLYSTGTKNGPINIPFPQNSYEPLFSLQVVYEPSILQERKGNAFFSLTPLRSNNPAAEDKSLAEGKAAIGDRIRMGEYYLEAREVRYWVVMSVRYEPGKPIVLASLWFGLGGMLMTFIGRIRRGGSPAA